MRATFNHQRYIANEMQRIAKPLFGMQKDAPSLKCFASEPEWLREGPQFFRPVFALPAPFVFGPGFAKIPEAESDERLIDVGISILRQYGLDPLQVLQRLLIAVERLQSVRAVV